MNAGMFSKVETKSKINIGSTWYKSLVAIPGFLKNKHIIGLNNTLDCNDIIGRHSNFTYYCNPDTHMYEFYINMTLTDQEAKKL